MTIVLLERLPFMLLEHASPSCGCAYEEIYRNQVDGNGGPTRKRRYLTTRPMQARLFHSRVPDQELLRMQSSEASARLDSAARHPSVLLSTRRYQRSRTAVRHRGSQGYLRKPAVLSASLSGHSLA
jgi:hypothetical protein